MLRQIIIVCIVCIVSNVHVFSQNRMSVTVNQNVIYVINGVSSKEDIGGVECNALKPQTAQAAQIIKFTNYNNFNVSVLYKLEVIDTTGTISHKTGTIVLGNGEAKTIEIKYPTLGDIKLITRKIGNITRPIQDNSDELTIVSGYLIKYPQHIMITGRAKAEELIKNLNSRKTYGRDNWRLPTDSELALLNIDNSNCNFYSTDNWNIYNIHPTVLVIVCDK